MFRGRDAVAQGLLTPAALRTTAWRRLFHGVYVDAQVSVTHPLRCSAALRYLLPPKAVIAGRSAAQLHGAGVGYPDDPVEVLVPSEVRSRRPAGVLIHRGAVPETDVRTVRGLRVTEPLRTCWDLSQWCDPPAAVTVVDRLAAAGRVFDLELAELAAERRGVRGHRRFATVAGLVDQRAESPPESELRVRLVLAGLPRPDSQYRVFVAGRFVARVDLAWPQWRIAVEYDGAWHGRPGQLHADRRRLNKLFAAGWIVLHVTSVRLRDDLDRIISEIRAAAATGRQGNRR